MNDQCLQCEKGPILWWKNDYINYYDFKCTVCGYVWHDTEPGKGRPQRNDSPHKPAVKKRPASRAKKAAKKSASGKKKRK